MKLRPALVALLATQMFSRAELIGYWPFDSLTVPGKDLGPNNYTLTLQGAFYNTGGKRGGGMSFNGTSAYLLGNIGKLPAAGSPYTISAWFKPTATGPRGIVGWGNWGVTRQVIALRLDGTNGFRHFWQGADLNATAAADYSDGQWHHIAAVYDGTTRALYMDGSLIGQDTPGAHSATNVSFRIGSTNSGEFYKGLLDEVAVWNHALSPPEIIGLATGGVPVGGPKITSLTATPASAYEGQSVELKWTVDISAITGAYSYQLLSGTSVLAAGTTTSGSITVTVPDLGGAAQTFTYTLRAVETGGGNIANTLGVNLAADPGRPVALPQPFLSTAGSTPLPVLLSGSDPNGGALTYAIATPPSKGTVSGTPPAVVYTANAGASGTDTFTFRADDGKYFSDPAAVTVAIQPPPAPASGILLDTTAVSSALTSGSFVAMMSAVDPNPGEARTFSLVSGDGDADNARFSIAGFQLRAGQSFTGLAGQLLRIRLRTTDAAGFSFEQAFVLTVTPPAGGMVINEIHCNGVDNTVFNEFIELYNAGAAPADLSGWRVSGGVNYAFPAGTAVAPGGFLLVAASPAAMTASFGKTALGPWTGALSSEGESIRLRDSADAVVDEVDYSIGFPWPVAAGGDGASMEKIHPLLDGKLGGSWRSATIPAANATRDTATPGGVNAQFSSAAPPAVRQVAHFPQQPRSGDPIIITAKATDPDGVASVTVSYQIVTPGNYLPRYLSNVPAGSNIATEARALNPAFELASNWTTVPMQDDGTLRDLQGGDSVWTVALPPLPNRTLLRYRITATDNKGTSVRTPYADDPAANFACYIYDGVPAYGATGAAALQSLPVYQLITRGSDWNDCMAYDPAKQISQGLPARFYYNWNGTFVYDGVVYDHIVYRTRGGNGRYLGAGKRSMRFKFHRGSYLAVRDQQGRHYPKKWQTLTTGKGIENHGSLTYGLNEWLNYRMWNAAGVPAPFAHFAHWRNVTTAQEQEDAWHGDFQGLSFIQEDYDVRFLEAHNLPKGNLYKLLNQTDAPLDQQRYQAPLGAKNGADHNWIETSLTGFTPPDAVAANVNLDMWYRSHALCQAVRHYDYWPNANKNMAYYFEPVYTPQNGNRGRLWILPFDTDASWGPSWNNGEDVVYNALFATSGGGGDAGTNPALWPGYFNAVREIRDLLFQPDQIHPLIDESAAIIAPVIAADYARWKQAPADAGSYSGITGPGMTSLAGLVQDMKNFAFTGGSWAGGSVGAGGRAAFLDTLQASQTEGTKIPSTPTLTYTGGAAHPVNDLRFQTSAFADPQGDDSFAAMQWRMAEVNDPTAPGYVSGEPLILEIRAGYDSGEMAPWSADFRFPARACTAGHTYRARVRMKDNTGRWSHWSAPVQFTATAADLTLYQNALVISELMYHPLPPTAAEAAQGWTEEDFEYVELRNTGTVPADLTDVRFTKGINFDFPAGFTAAPGANVLVVRHAAAFASRYGAGRPVAGIWQAGDFLSNGGELIKLSYGAGSEITAFTWNDKAPWPVSADGDGFSLVRLYPENRDLDPNDGRNWRASAAAGGSPGGDDRRGFSDWAAGYAIAASPPADPDGDGLSNLLEFMLGTNPVLASSAAYPVPSVQSLSAGGTMMDFAVLTFSRQDVPGCSAGVEFAGDLSAWPFAGVPVQAEVRPDGSLKEVWRAPAAFAGRLYGRLRVSAVP